MPYLDRVIKATMKSIPGFRNPDTFNISLITLDVVNALDGTDTRGNPRFITAQLAIQAILYKKPRLNKVNQLLDAVKSYEVYEGNVIEPKVFVSALQDAMISRSLGDITGTAIINGVQSKVRLVSIGKDYLEAYNRQMGRVIQIEVIGGALNV